jgi:dolichol-phosphate mannosyltransferase
MHGVPSDPAATSPLPASAASAPAVTPGHAVAAVPDIAVIVPTYNARAKVPLLLAALERALGGVAWEALFVDDNSPDGTGDAVRDVGATDARVRCLRRIGRRGAVGAGLEGMLASQARTLLVVDIDGPHDAALFAAMLEQIRGGADLVAASRYVGGGATHPWSKALVRRLTGADLADPISGTFAIRRDAFDALAPALSPNSAAVLLDILLTARGSLRVAEQPAAARGAANYAALDAALAIGLADHVVARLTRGAVSVRFLMFCLVGLTGVGIHMGILWSVLRGAALPFAAAQTAAAIGAMAWNFTLNNVFTYRDRKLTGLAFFGGLVRFQLVCAIGAISNVGVASFIYRGNHNWWLAGLAGVLMGAVWNYAVTSVFVWRKA